MKILLAFMGLLFFTAVQAQPIIRDSSTRYYFRDHEMIPDSIDKKWIIDNMPEPLEPVTKYIKYPEEAHRTNLEGKVILLGLVGENGLDLFLIGDRIRVVDLHLRDRLDLGVLLLLGGAK